jgi:alkylation response protein AidB-like acyl-CoA dehydrogenase
LDFQPTPDQLELQQTVRDFCESALPHSALPDYEIGGASEVEASLWQSLVDLGVFQLQRAESDGGLGLGAADASLVFEELGRALLPGPVVWTALAADLVDGAASGERRVGGLDLTTADSNVCVVEYFDRIDSLLLLRRDGVFALEAAQLSARLIDEPLDPLTPISYLEALPEVGAAEQVADAAAAEALRWRGLALVSALQLGIAEATLDLSLAYAKEREQFGRTIGSFQSIKHILADMFARQELARAAVYAAGATIDQPIVGSAEHAARGARIVAGDAAMKNARACIQVHGGMGYTWEVPAHYYLKRCWVLESMFGAPGEHCEALAARVADEAAQPGAGV